MGKGNHVYRGERFRLGGAQVMCDGIRLPPRNDVCDHSPTGLEWGYGGSGPAQLALAILIKEYGVDVARGLYQEYKWLVIARLQQREWTLTSEDVAQGIAEIRRCREVKQIDQSLEAVCKREEVDAHNELFRLGVRGSDGFRQWYYVGHCKVNPAAVEAVKELIAEGKSAKEIGEELYRKHA